MQLLFFERLPVVPPSRAVPGRGARSSAASGASLTTGTELSSSRRSSKHSDGASKSECSSLAPYWVPDEIKHYFRHRHSASDEDDSSRKVDAALQAIGLERELPTIDSGDWPRRKLCRKPLHALLVAMAAITAALLVLLIVAVSTKYRMVSPGSGRWRSGAEGDDAVGAHVANENGDDLPTSAESEEDIRVGVFQEAPNDLDSRSTHLKEKDKSCDDDDSTAKRRVKAKHRAAVGGFEPDGNSRIWTKAVCARPVFRFCSGGPPEFYYNGSSQACVMLSARSSGLCNRGRNRFTSIESCQTQCTHRKRPSPHCLEKAVLSECKQMDIVHTWWWYMEGKGCRRWRFPEGFCPSMDAHVFRTSIDCVRRCTKCRQKPCRAPTPVPCQVQYLRFGYIAVQPAHNNRSRRCHALPSATGRGAQQHCLAGDNRFPTMEACRKSCMRGYF
ncbi:hypothetical protein HPB50_022252 [Hyalomma asiaticum]|uniref:Uncharacterized protein n=1 Tax=Hyalomma asiaticum TaxID=266040 RepID=A0ACB7RKF8_HYAAI|nr:hypothetical protein HPB50_022252 [Hyalomma asiaticum]